MGALFNIISYSIGNLFLGVLLTAVGVALMFFIIRSWFSNRAFTPISYVVGAILFLFLSFQAILLCGAVTIRSYSTDVEEAINGWVRDVPEYVTFDEENSQAILESIQAEWPLVGYFIGGADFTGHTPLNIASAMADELRAYMARFIWRRVGWSVLFVVVAAFVVIQTMEQTGRARRTASSRARSTGGSRRRGARPKRYDDF